MASTPGRNPNPPWEEVKRLYTEALGLPPRQREALLAQASPEARREVESLLRVDCATGWNGRPLHPAGDFENGSPSGLAAGDRVGNYQLESLLSAGGMGEVYLARGRAGKRVALKLLRRHLIADPQAVERFKREARAASALRHPNIVNVYEFGESDAGLFMAMEWLDGSTFRCIMDAGQVEISRAMDYAVQTAGALAAAHAEGILHRDIKPENIMLCEDELVKILDFGLARHSSIETPDPEAFGASGTITGSLSGTLLYMPPEILRGEPATSASDVYALGAFLYELFAGKHPFAAATPLEVLEAIESRQIAPAASERAEIPAAANGLILRMLDREPSRRPEAAEVWETLRRLSA